jgi:hypothetical protein
MLALAVALTCGSPELNAQAAAGGVPKVVTERKLIFLDVILHRKTICPHNQVDIEVNARYDSDILLPKGKSLHVDDGIMDGLTIQAVSETPSVGTVEPPQQVTGLDVAAKPGGAIFRFHATKVGETVLIFTATYHRSKFITLQPIKVENCGYSVDMHATDIDSGGGVTIWIVGNLETTIKGDGGEMSGSGAFAMTSGFIGPPCSISYSEVENATTITGNVDDNDQLVLNFMYEPGQLTESASCPGGGGTSTHTIDLTNTGIASLTLPATGGTRSLRFTYAGSDFAPGTMTIDVQPESEQAGG